MMEIKWNDIFSFLYELEEMRLVCSQFIIAIQVIFIVDLERY